MRIEQLTTYYVTLKKLNGDRRRYADIPHRQYGRLLSVPISNYPLSEIFGDVIVN